MLVIEKIYNVESADGSQLSAYVREFVTSESQTIFTWPCAILLASFLSASKVAEGKVVVELGAGCGLPSIIAALSGAKHCHITERAAEPLILQNLQLNVAKNGLCAKCSVVNILNIHLITNLDITNSITALTTRSDSARLELFPFYCDP
jgi:predicted nicotinamide N-methyase